MKKSIQKACSIALVLTPTLALAGLGTIIGETQKNNNVVIFAEEQNKTENVMSFNQVKKSATVGSDYEIPAVIFNSTENYTSSYEVYSPTGSRQNVDAGKVTVTEIGTYKIVYKIVTDSNKTYVGTLNFKGELSDVNIQIESNDSRILPKKLGKNHTGKLYVPNFKVLDSEDEEMAEDLYDVSIRITSPTNQELPYNVTTGEIVTGQLVEGVYSVVYTAKSKNGYFIGSKTVEFNVVKEYENSFTLTFDYSTSKPTSADIGKTLKLPTPVGKNKSEEVNVYYNIKAYRTINGTLTNVSDNVYNGKKVIEGNEFTADTKGDFIIRYEVKDALGNVAEITGYTIYDVSDSIDPLPIVVDSYDKTNTTDLKDQSYKLPSYTEAKNIIVKAIFAEDLGSPNFDDLTLTRTIKNSSLKEIYKEKTSENAFKELVFNKQESFVIDENKMVDTKIVLEDGKYSIIYTAKDKAGNESSVTFYMTVKASFDFEKKPEVKFNDTFPVSVENGEEITFGTVTATDEFDDRLNLTYLYKFDNDSKWTVLEADKDTGKYSFKADKQGANNVKVRVIAENDSIATADQIAGDISDIADAMDSYSRYKYGFIDADILIKNQTDAAAPTTISISGEVGEVAQGSTVTLPEVVFTDDLVKYLNVDLVVNHIDADGNRTPIDCYDGAFIRTSNIYTVSGVKLDAYLAGDYEVAYVATDAAGNVTIQFTSFTAKENIIVSEPQFSNLPEQLLDGKLELGDSITMPIPEIIHSSGTTAEYYIQRVSGPTDFELNNEKFTPKKEGVYELQYFAIINDGSNDTTIESKKFKVTVEDTKAPTIAVNWDLNASYDVSTIDKEVSVTIPKFSASDNSQIDIENSKIVISSESFTRIILFKDMDKEWNLDNHGNFKVNLNYNEIYTVTYTAVDKSQKSNESTKEFTIKVGDLVAPILKIDDKTVLKAGNSLVSDTVKLGSTISVDSSKVEVSDNISEISFNNVKITLKNTTTDTVIKNRNGEESKTYEFEITTAGTYEMVFEVTDKANNKTTHTKTFTVNEASNKGMSDTEIIGTVLIVVAVLVLAGVIVYFIVTKKKVDKIYK